MSSDISGYASLAALGTIIGAVIAGGYYYANSNPTPYGSPTGMAAYQGQYQMGGKKSRKKNRNVNRKTRRV